ncbi:death-associated inhibitor of apoptosis 1-like, partial [Aphis craccivora]
RFKTYNSYPSTSCQNKYSLSESGLKYTGVGDIVECLFCGPVLQKWSNNDIPWVEHAKWNSKCIFVLLCKGKEFIENVKDEYVKASHVCDFSGSTDQVTVMSLSSLPLPNFQTAHTQSCAVTIIVNNITISVAAIYCLPKHTLSSNQFNIFFHTLRKNCIASDDINFKHIKWGCRTTNSRGSCLLHSKEQKLKSHLTFQPPLIGTHLPENLLDHGYKDWLSILGPDGNAFVTKVLCDFAIKHNVQGYVLRSISPFGDLPLNETVGIYLIAYKKQLEQCKPELIIGVSISKSTVTNSSSE